MKMIPTPKIHFFGFLLSFTFLMHSQAFGWGDLGHETVAEIAERILSSDSKTKIAIQGIIGVEPFGISATWPDAARNDERFAEFAPYHYLTIYRDNRVSEKSALTVLKKYPNILTDLKAPRESKMLAIRYLIHVVGDIHQPLHIGNEFDRGGNFCQILWQKDPARPGVSKNLHSVWDSTLVNQVSENFKNSTRFSGKYWGYSNLAAALMAKYESKFKTTEKVDIDAWIQESRKLRETQVYPDQLADDARPYCKEKWDEIKPADIPVVGASYMEKSGLIVEERLVIAGARLAALLKEIFKESTAKTPVEAEILKSLQLTDTHD